MKLRVSIFAALMLGASLFTASAVTKAEDSSAPAPTKSKAPGAQFAESISTITGVAISPLLGTGAYGAVQYYRTPADKRHTLPWFAQPWFWTPALLLVGACFIKDTAGTALPTALKKPLDVVETVEHKISGLVATGAFVPFVATLMQDPNGSSSMLSAMGFAAADVSWLYNIIMVPVMMIVGAFIVYELYSGEIPVRWFGSIQREKRPFFYWLGILFHLVILGIVVYAWIDGVRIPLSVLFE